VVGRTHEIAAAVSLVAVGAATQIPAMNFPTFTGVLLATLVGGEFPDIDQPTGRLWERLPLGGILGRLITPFAGGHRHLTHSLLGFALFGYLANLLLHYLHQYILIDMSLVWISFMIGFASHIIADGFTEEGVPLLFPLPWSFGLPPISRWRIKTGHWFEHLFVAPGLIIAGLYLLAANHAHFVAFLHRIHS
jgi:membrane-bound metal-dependent hydrolase YbcI (DUF457 family)